MFEPSDLPKLSEADRQRLLEVRKHFEDFCQASESDTNALLGLSLEYFLPAAENPLRRVTLLTLIPTDLRRHWQKANRVLLEEYCSRFPELGGTAQLPADLVAEEFAIRVQNGDTPTLDEYQQRFPRQFPLLQTVLSFLATKDQAAANDPAAPHSARAADQGPTATPPAATPVRNLSSNAPLSPADSASTGDQFATYHAQFDSHGNAGTPSTPVDEAASAAARLPRSGDEPDEATQRMELSDTPHLGSGANNSSSGEASSSADDADSMPTRQYDVHRASSRPAAPAPSAVRSAFAARDPQPGEVLGDGKYRLLQFIDKGQYGQVWEAETTQGGIRVALKMIQFPVGHQMSQQEQRSLELIKAMRYPLLVSVQAYWVELDRLHIAMDLADNTLSGRLKECQQLNAAGQREGGIPVNELLSYTVDAADAIDFLHRQNIIHRDIKPANILIVNGRAKVGDFGLARVLERHSEASLAEATVIGTPMYMGPEVYKGFACTQTDLFALASTYVQMRTGVPPFPQNRPLAELMHAILSDPPRLDGLEVRERAVLEKALAKDPKKRFATCHEFADELRRSLEPEPYPVGRRILQALLLVTLVVATTILVHRLFFRFGIQPIPTVTVTAGQRSSPFEIRLKKPYLRNQPISVAFEVLPLDEAQAAAGLDMAITPEELDPDDQTLSRKAQIAVGLPAVQERNDTLARRIRVTATQSSGLTATQIVRLDIEPAVVQVPKFPPHVAPHDAPGADSAKLTWRGSPEIVGIGNRVYRRTYFVSTPAGQQLEFRLIDGDYEDEDGRKQSVAPFYIMTTKVWNALFDEFLTVTGYEPPAFFHEGAIRWQRDSGQVTTERMGVAAPSTQRYPAFQVTALDALLFAKWAGGSLPERKQWGAAAQRPLQFDGQMGTEQRKGPYDPRFDVAMAEYVAQRAAGQSAEFPTGVAVGRKEEGPLAVGTATLDVTPPPDEVHDLAGNGYEWTRDVTAPNDRNVAWGQIVRQVKDSDSPWSELDVAAVKEQLRNNSANEYCMSYIVSASYEDTIPWQFTEYQADKYDIGELVPVARSVYTQVAGKDTRYGVMITFRVVLDEF